MGRIEIEGKTKETKTFAPHLLIREAIALIAQPGLETTVIMNPVDWLDLAATVDSNDQPLVPEPALFKFAGANVVLDQMMISENAEVRCGDVTAKVSCWCRMGNMKPYEWWEDPKPPKTKEVKPVENEEAEKLKELFKEGIQNAKPSGFWGRFKILTGKFESKN